MVVVRGERGSPHAARIEGFQKLRRQTTHSPGVIPMPPSCLPLSLVPSRAKARFCWANWFCYNSPTPNMEVIMFFTLSPFTFFFIKFWNISCIQKGIKTVRVSPLYSPPNKKKQHYKQRERSAVMLPNSLYFWPWKNVWKLLIHSFVDLVSSYHFHSFSDMLLLGRERRLTYIHNITLNEFIIIYIIICFILDIDF